jgi:hypothetical protein
MERIQECIPEIKLNQAITPLMKRHLVLFFAIALTYSAVAQTMQPCIVKQYNQKEVKTPLPGVEVMVSNAGTEVSDARGLLIAH